MFLGTIPTAAGRPRHHGYHPPCRHGGHLPRYHGNHLRRLHQEKHRPRHFGNDLPRRHGNEATAASHVRDTVLLHRQHQTSLIPIWIFINAVSSNRCRVVFVDPPPNERQQHQGKPSVWQLLTMGVRCETKAWLDVGAVVSRCRRRHCFVREVFSHQQQHVQSCKLENTYA